MIFARTMYRLRCDGCGRESHDFAHPDRMMDVLKANGWEDHGKLNNCPDCVQSIDASLRTNHGKV